MKYLFASDLHGSAYYTEKLIARFDAENANRLVLLGDLLYHGPRNPLPEGHNPQRVAELLNGKKEFILAVRGNCDAEIDQMLLDFPCLADYAAIDLGDKLLYLTHGHLPLPPLQRNSLLLNGHFHVPACEQREGYRYLNCGSLSLPKEHSPHSYLVYENGVFVWKDEEGNEFMRFSL